MTRWWWQGEVHPEKGDRPRAFSLYHVIECGDPSRAFIPPGSFVGGVAVQDVTRWIDHLEGLPPR